VYKSKLRRMQQRMGMTPYHRRTLDRLRGTIASATYSHAVLTTLLLISFACCASENTPGPPYCPSSQRYDVRSFPPRCIDCDRVVSNQMQVARVTTVLLTRRAAQKFSPGLPQNQTCGCWRTPVNQSMSFDVMLNSSWIVTGLAFHSERRLWLREFEIHASEDNRTFLPWGVYTMANFTSASMALFAYPIRARLFRVTVRKYANHFINASAGFQLFPVQALVSRDQPFSCACPMLSTGECCPFTNMTVRNDTCVWCMDPTNIQARMANGCAKCKFGTFEFQGRCYQNRRSTQRQTNALSVGNQWSNGIEWQALINYTTDAQSMVLLFITNKTASQQHPCMRGGNMPSTGLSTACCLREYYYYHGSASSSGPASQYTPILWNFTPPLADDNAHIAGTETGNGSCQIKASLNPPATAVKQFVQFDRGRQTTLLLSFTEREIREWARCNGAVCSGTVGALFITTVAPMPADAFMSHMILYPLHFDMQVPSLVCATARSLPTLARAELHHYRTTDTFTVRMLGVELNGDSVRFQWTNSTSAADTGWTPTANTHELIVTAPPLDSPLAALRISDGVTTLRIDPPMTPVIHNAVKQSTLAGILVEVVYGFGFSRGPASGDTDQIVIVTAKSTQPARLKRLATSQAGETTAYTNAKGFISDPRRVMDLGVACYQDKALMVKWLLQAIQLLDTPGPQYTQFIQRSCRMMLTGEAAKGYWLVPWRGTLSADRMLTAGLEVVAEFA